MTNRLHLLVEQLDRATERALATAEALDTRAYVAPVPGEWAATQVIHHLLTAERLIVAALRQSLAVEPGSWRRAGLQHRVRSLLLRLAMRLPGLRFKRPAAVPPPPPPEAIVPLPELRTEWQRVRRELEQVLHEFPGRRLGHGVFRHPRAGWLTVGQTVAFVLDHILHHQQQLGRIVRALGK